MGRNDLPREHDGPLLYQELVDVLDTLTGEQVVCLPEPRRGHSGLDVGTEQVGSLVEAGDRGLVAEG